MLHEPRDAYVRSIRISMVFNHHRLSIVTRFGFIIIVSFYLFQQISREREREIEQLGQCEDSMMMRGTLRKEDKSNHESKKKN